MRYPVLSKQDKTAIDTLVKVFFDTFTNKNGQTPNIKSIYDLLIPQGIIIKNLNASPEIYSLESFITPREQLLNDGLLAEFEEHEVKERTDILGDIAQRVCLYRKSGILSGEAFETQGVKR